jgi:hypothetical protein
MNSRELALELAALPSDLRDGLLADLPPAKRSELSNLIDEVQPLVEAPGGFAALMQTLENDAPSARPLADRALLGRVLHSETMPVKKQLLDVFAGGQGRLLTPHVRALVGDYLESQASHLPAPPQPSSRKSGWFRFWK